MDKKPKVVIELEGLIEQATKERSHFYVKSVAEKAILAIGTLIIENNNLREISKNQSSLIENLFADKEFHKKDADMKDRFRKWLDDAERILK
jgi:hypothetical protein